MTEMTKAPERKLRHGKTGHPGAGGLPIDLDAEAGTCIDNPRRRVERPSAASWPLKVENVSPLAWWRSLPSDAFSDAEYLLLVASLAQTAVLRGGDDLAAALAGNPAAAIDTAFSMMPIEAITLTADIAMTALLRCALDRHAAAALVLAQIIGLTNLDYFATELAASWCAFGLRHSTNPRKFGEAVVKLRAVFSEHTDNGGAA
jgi:hypothetical protein